MHAAQNPLGAYFEAMEKRIIAAIEEKKGSANSPPLDFARRRAIIPFHIERTTRKRRRWND